MQHDLNNIIDRTLGAAAFIIIGVPLLIALTILAMQHLTTFLHQYGMLLLVVANVVYWYSIGVKFYMKRKSNLSHIVK